MFAPGAQTPRPPGKAGRYESTLEGFGPPNLPEKKFANNLSPPQADFFDTPKA